MATAAARVEIAADAKSGPGGARLRVAAAASGLLGCTFMFAVPAQVQRWPVYAVVFLAIAWGHALLAGALWDRPSPAALLAGIWGNLTVAALYLLSRTVGLPFGPLRPLGQQPGPSAAHLGSIAGGVGNGTAFLPQPLGGTRIETVGVPDLGVVGLGFAVVVILVSLLPAPTRRWTTNTMCACGLALWALRWLGVLG